MKKETKKEIKNWASAFMYLFALVGLQIVLYVVITFISDPIKQYQVAEINFARAEKEIDVYEVLDEFVAVVTAYSEIDSCHTGASCLMASGKKAYVGAIACPRNIKFGTRVLIDDKPYTCEDRVSTKYPERFDIFMGYGEKSYEKAIKYGKQNKEIKICKKSDL